MAPLPPLGYGERQGDNRAGRCFRLSPEGVKRDAQKIVVARGEPDVRQLSGVLALAGSLAAWPLQAQDPDVLVTRVTDDRPGIEQCSAPSQLPNLVPDVNNMPQGEVWIDVSNDGLLAAAAKDYRFSPVDDTTYNTRVWNGLYLSSDGGHGWRNLMFEGSDPNQGIVGVTAAIFGQQPGREVRLTHESDPVVAFDRDGNAYTSVLAFEPAPDFGGSPSAIVVSRWDRGGRLVPGTTHFTGLEDDPGLFDDKNWIAVSRDARPDRTIVVSSWRLFTFGDAPPAPPGGYIAVSADGSRSFSAPIQLPVPPGLVANSQFYQPLIGPDPRSGRSTLYVIYRTSSSGLGLRMHLLEADIDGFGGGTAALYDHLAQPTVWTSLAVRIGGLSPIGAHGFDGSFRFGSFFMPAVDRANGWLYAVTHALDGNNQGSQVVVYRSEDGGDEWIGPVVIDYPGRGFQLMPSVAVHSGTVSVVWYDSRHDPDFVPLGGVFGVDVYFAEMGARLDVRRVRRLTPSLQTADHPVFTRARPAGIATAEELPHDAVPPGGVAAASAQDCDADRYGFIGDYIGLAADADYAYAAWTDLRDLDTESSVCTGHSCTSGNRNQNIYFARIPVGR